MSINRRKKYNIVNFSNTFDNQEQIKPAKMMYYDNTNEYTDRTELDSKLRNILLSIGNSIFYGMASQKEISKLIYRYIDIDRTFSADIDCYISCYQNYKKIKSDSENATEVFLINGKDGDIFHNKTVWTPSHIHNILLASAALPIIYTPVNINGKIYSDGGLESKTSAQLSKLGKGNVPYNVFLENDPFNNIIIVDFDDDSIPPQPQKNIIEIKMRKSKEDILELIDFTTQNIIQQIDAGKKEAKKAFILFQDTISRIKKYPPPYIEHKCCEWNKTTVYKDLIEVAKAMELGQIEIIFESELELTIKALSWIFSYYSIETVAPPFTVPVLRFFRSYFGTQIKYITQKYTCYPTNDSKRIRLYLNII